MGREDRGERKVALYTQRALAAETSILQAIRLEFDAQRATVLAALDHTRRSLRTKDFVAELIKWDEYDARMQRVIAPYMFNVIIEAGFDAMQEIGLQPSEFDPFTSQIRRAQDKRNTKIAKDVNDETEKQLRATITEGINAGESNQQLRARIEAVFGFASTKRADLIASTEVTRAQAFADINAWEQSGIVEAKEWYTAKDERVCPFCNAMDGEILHLHENYFNKGDVQTEEGTNRNGDRKTSTYNHSYDDVKGPPLHPRCRCTLLPVRKTL